MSGSRVEDSSSLAIEANFLCFVFPLRLKRSRERDQYNVNFNGAHEMYNLHSSTRSQQRNQLAVVRRRLFVSLSNGIFD